MRRLRLRGDRGSAAVEFAIVIPVLLLLVLGIVGSRPPGGRLTLRRQQ